MQIDDIVFIDQPLHPEAQLMLCTLQPNVVAQVWLYKSDDALHGSMVDLQLGRALFHVPGYRIALEYIGTLDRRHLVEREYGPILRTMVTGYLRHKIQASPARFKRYKLPEAF